MIFNARFSHRLNVFTWLKKREQLCYFLLQQINSLGNIKGIDTHVREELANTRQYLQYGVAEAEQYRCQSMQASFLLYQALFDLSELVDIQQNMQRLRQAQQLFQSALLVQQNNHLSMALVSQKTLTDILLWEHQCVHDRDGVQQRLIETRDDDRVQTLLIDSVRKRSEFQRFFI
jgi:hypothetical protein